MYTFIYYIVYKIITIFQGSSSSDDNSDDDAHPSALKRPRQARVTRAQCRMPRCDCTTRHTPTDDDVDTSAGRGRRVRGGGDTVDDDEESIPAVRGRGVTATRGDGNSDNEQAALPVRGRGRSRGRSRSRGTARSRSRSTRGHGRRRGHGRGRGRGRGRGTTATPGSTTTPGSTNYLEAVSDNWHKREPDSCTYVYNKTPGSTVPIPDGTSSLDIFCRFFTDEVWDLLVTETNRYAHDHPSTKPNARVYDDVDIDEMKAFIGVLILMGILRLPRLEMYWSTSELHKYISTPSISSILQKLVLSKSSAFFMWQTMLSRQHLQQHQINYSKSEH